MEVRFVDREKEISALRYWASEFRALPFYIYGSEGCGKTRLLKEFIMKFNEFFGEDAIAIYIDAMERDSVSKAILTSRSLQLAKEVLKSLTEKFTGFKVGEALANSIATILERAVLRRKYEGSYILIVIDDVARAIGLDRIEWYVKWLYELMWKLAEEYKPKAINFIATTSEGISRKLVARHRHAGIHLIWNLDKEGFEELFYELSPPNHIRFDDVWFLLGGNPGKLIELASKWHWDMETMIKYYTALLRELMIELIKKGLRNEIELVLDDIDNLSKALTPKMNDLEQVLVEKNLIIYKNWMTLNLDHVNSDKEIGIGEYYAWQVPMFREILRKILNTHEA